MQPGPPGGPPQGYGQPPMGYAPPGMPTGAPSAPNPAQTPAIIILVCAVAMLVGTFTKSWMKGKPAGGDDDDFGDRNVEIGIGLTGMEAMGISMSWGDLDEIAERSASMRAKYGDDDDDDGPKKVPIQIKLFGYLGFLGGLAAAGVAAAAGIMGLTRNLRKVKMKPFLGIIAGAAGAQVLFLISALTSDMFKAMEKGVEFGISWSGIVSILALVGGLVVLMQMLGPHVAQAIANAPAPAPLPMAYAQPGAPMMGAPMQQPPMAAAPQPMAAQPQVMTCPRCQGQAAFVAQYNRYFCNACQQYV